MACGCETACGCTVIGDGSTAEVVRDGDTFIVSAIHPILGVADTDCIELDVDEDKILTATPVISPDDTSVILECTEDGFAASVRVDQASSAIVSEGPLGLRVDIPPADPTPDSAQPG